MIQDDFIWLKMTYYDSRWLKMTQDDSRWLNIQNTQSEKKWAFWTLWQSTRHVSFYPWSHSVLAVKKNRRKGGKVNNYPITLQGTTSTHTINLTTLQLSSCTWTQEKSFSIREGTSISNVNDILYLFCFMTRVFCSNYDMERFCNHIFQQL